MLFAAGKYEVGKVFCSKHVMAAVGQAITPALRIKNTQD